MLALAAQRITPYRKCRSGSPTIRLLRELAPKKEVVAVFPPRRPSIELQGIAHRHMQLSWKHIARNSVSFVYSTGERQNDRLPAELAASGTVARQH
jgi:hypothetical protein